MRRHLTFFCSLALEQLAIHQLRGALIKQRISKSIFAGQPDTILTAVDRIPTPGPAASNSVLARRTACKWAQAELAKRAGISRPAVSAIESGRLTPSVTAALSLARTFGCSVEELFSGRPAISPQGPAWAWEPWWPDSGYWDAEVTGRHLLYPVESLALNAEPQDGVSQAGVLRQTHAERPDRTLIVATCDPAAGLLARAYARDTGFRMLVFPRNGGNALELAGKRLIHVAALHRSTTDMPERNAEVGAQGAGIGSEAASRGGVAVRNRAGRF